MVIPWLRQVRNGAGVGGCARDYFDAGEVVFVFGFAIIAAHHHLPLIPGGDTRDEEEAKEEHDDGTPDVNCNVGLTVDCGCETHGTAVYGWIRQFFSIPVIP